MEHDKQWTDKASDDGNDPRISGHCYCHLVQHESMDAHLCLFYSMCICKYLYVCGIVYALMDQWHFMIQLLPSFR